MNNKQDSLKKNQLESKKIGWFCTYVPEEIITACGFSPFRITGNKKAKRAEGYFPINFCPFVKSAMEELIENKEHLGGIIFTNSCDAMKRFYDMARIYIKNIPAFILDVPRNKDELAFMHYKDGLYNMIKFLESIKGSKLSKEKLKNTIDIYTQKRKLLKKIQKLFKNNTDTIESCQYFGLIKSSMISEPEHSIERLKEFIDLVNKKIKDKKDSKDKPKNNYKKLPPLMIIGNFIDEEKLWEVFDQLHCKISVDDTCSTSRYFQDIYRPEEFIKIKNSLKNNDQKIRGKHREIDRLITDIAARYLYKPQCMRMSDLGAKINEIKENIESNNIKGVVFCSQKFCDNTLLFYPLLRRYLNEAGIPSIFLEIEHKNLSIGQVKTRIQAFIEII